MIFWKLTQYFYFQALLHRMQQLDAAHPDVPEVVLRIRELEDQLPRP